VADVVPIYVIHVPNPLHHNNVGVTYLGTSNFRMELVKSIPLYYVAMFQAMVKVNKVPL